MNQEQLLMVVVAFLIGYFFKQIMGSVCGGRLVEGWSKEKHKKVIDMGILDWHKLDDCHKILQSKSGGKTGRRQSCKSQWKKDTVGSDLLQHIFDEHDGVIPPIPPKPED